MEEHLDIGTKVLNGFLKVMVVILIFILAAVVISLILAALVLIAAVVGDSLIRGLLSGMLGVLVALPATWIATKKIASL